MFAIVFTQISPVIGRGNRNLGNELFAGNRLINIYIKPYDILFGKIKWFISETFIIHIYR